MNAVKKKLLSGEKNFSALKRWKKIFHRYKQDAVKKIFHRYQQNAVKKNFTATSRMRWKKIFHG